MPAHETTRQLFRRSWGCPAVACEITNLSDMLLSLGARCGDGLLAQIDTIGTVDTLQEKRNLGIQTDEKDKGLRNLNEIAHSRSDCSLGFACRVQPSDDAVKKSNGCVCKTQNREACFPSEQVDPAANCDTDTAVRAIKRTSKHLRPQNIQEFQR